MGSLMVEIAPELVGVRYVPNFWPDHAALMAWAVASVPWDDRIKARKTAGYGVPYDYAGLTYAPSDFPAPLEAVRRGVAAEVGWEPNNCLLNYYPDGRSRMGFHSDSAMGLAGDGGVVIVSLGVARRLRFRRISNLDDRVNVWLEPGSLLSMGRPVQDAWQHALPRASTYEPRISLTFRAVCG